MIVIRRRVPLVAWLICIGLVACADPKPSSYPTQNTYVEDSTAGPSDLLEIRVAKQDQLSGEYEIDATGVVSLPWAGIVQASGKTLLEIQSDIQTRLADGYLRNPQVSVRFKERRSKRVSVLGEVHRSTTIPFTSGMTISEAVSGAGGFTSRAWENAVKVKRGHSEYTVPVKAIASGSAPPFYMRPGDTVYVPRSPI